MGVKDGKSGRDVRRTNLGMNTVIGKGERMNYTSEELIPLVFNWQ